MDGHSKQFVGEFCVLLIVSSIWVSYADLGENTNKATVNHVDLEKRYLGALAKNGRLPKFHSGNKRTLPSSSSSSQKLIQDQKALDNVRAPIPSGKNPDTLSPSSDSWKEDKRHIGAFLQAHGRPNFAKSNNDDHIRQYRSVSLNYPPLSFNEYVTDDAFERGDDDNDLYLVNDEIDENGWRASDKRNIAALARLGRLNAARFGRPYSGHKREFVIANNDDDDDEDTAEDSDCLEEDIAEKEDRSKNLIQQKRYIAALARTGRLPPWHPRRLYWDSKRDSNTYWPRFMHRTDSRKSSEAPLRIAKSTKANLCKTKSGRSSEVMPTKRNVGLLARKGLLPWRPFVVS